MKPGKVLAFLLPIIFLSACSGGIDTNMSEPIMEFEFTTQDEETLSLEDLKGDWWIANLSYTNCRTICPRTTANMVKVQKELKEDNLSPQIVSFSIDPSNDTPEDLKEYAEEYGANLETWDFLTGYDFETIQEISESTFHAVLEKGATGQRSHGYAFYLINPDGNIIKQYDGMSSDELDLLVGDVKSVLN